MLLQILEDLGIGFLDVHAGKGRDFVDEAALEIHQVDHRQTILLARQVVVFTISRGRMDDAGTV